MEIIPAIMPRSLADLKEKMSQVDGHVHSVQIDVMDGKFVPNKTWPYIGDAGEFADITSGKEELPFSSSLDIEVDLMVSDPLKVIESWIQAGARRFVIHRKSIYDLGVAIGLIKKFNIGDDSFLLKTEIGLALDITSKIDDLAPYMDDIDFVQCMGISRVGFQRQPFNDTVLGKIRNLRQEFPNIIISVDGGVNRGSAEELAYAGANRLVIGSALFDSPNISEEIEFFERI